MGLRSLEDYENERQREIEASKNWDKAEIACPMCGSELLFVYQTILLSSPSQRAVKCSQCDFFTNVLA